MKVNEKIITLFEKIQILRKATMFDAKTKGDDALSELTTVIMDFETRLTKMEEKCLTKEQ